MKIDEKPFVSMGCTVREPVCPLCPPGEKSGTCNGVHTVAQEDVLRFFTPSFVSTPPDEVSVFQVVRDDGTKSPPLTRDPGFFSVSLVEAAKDASVDKAREHLDAFLHAVKDAQFLLLGDRIVSIDRRADGVVSIKIAPMKEE